MQAEFMADWMNGQDLWASGVRGERLVNMRFESRQGVVSHATLCESYNALWVIQGFVSHATLCESYNVLWVMQRFVSHTTFCESCNALWVMQRFVSHATFYESCNALWVMQCFVSHATLCEPCNALWVMHKVWESYMRFERRQGVVVMQRFVSHAVLCESYNALWVMHKVWEQARCCESCNVLWVMHEVWDLAKCCSHATFYESFMRFENGQDVSRSANCSQGFESLRQGFVSIMYEKSVGKVLWVLHFVYCWDVCAFFVKVFCITIGTH